jgi:hypothetical protein
LPYRIAFSRNSLSHLLAFTAREQRIIRDALGALRQRLLIPKLLTNVLELSKERQILIFLCKHHKPDKHPEA